MDGGVQLPTRDRSASNSLRQSAGPGENRRYDAPSRSLCYESCGCGKGSSLAYHSAEERATPAMYIGVLRRRKWIILLFALVVPMAAFIVSARQEALYQSSAEVYLNKQDIGSAVTGIENQTLFANEDRAAETQVNLASLPTVAERALKIAGVKT